LQEPPGQEGLEDDNLPDIFGSSMGGWSSPTSTVAFAMQETEANRFSKHPLTPSDCVGANGFGVSNIVGMERWEELTEKKERNRQNCETSSCKKKVREKSSLHDPHAETSILVGKSKMEENLF